MEASRGTGRGTLGLEAWDPPRDQIRTSALGPASEGPEWAGPEWAGLNSIGHASGARLPWEVRAREGGCDEGPGDPSGTDLIPALTSPRATLRTPAAAFGAVAGSRQHQSSGLLPVFCPDPPPCLPCGARCPGGGDTCRDSPDLVQLKKIRLAGRAPRSLGPEREVQEVGPTLVACSPMRLPAAVLEEGSWGQSGLGWVSFPSQL